MADTKTTPEDNAASAPDTSGPTVSRLCGSDHMYLVKGLPTVPLEGTIRVECRRTWSIPPGGTIATDTAPIAFEWCPKMGRLVAKTSGAASTGHMHIISDEKHDIITVHNHSVNYITYGDDGYVAKMTGYRFNRHGDVTNTVIGFSICHIHITMEPSK